MMKIMPKQRFAILGILLIVQNMDIANTHRYPVLAPMFLVGIDDATTKIADITQCNVSQETQATEVARNIRTLAEGSA